MPLEMKLILSKGKTLLFVRMLPSEFEVYDKDVLYAGRLVLVCFSPTNNLQFFFLSFQTLLYNFQQL